MSKEESRLSCNELSMSTIAAAHELKAPLVLINNIAQVLNDKTLILDDDEREKYLNRMILTSRRLLRLTQQLTYSYRVAEGKSKAFDLELAPVNVYEVCLDAIDEIVAYAREIGQDIRMRSRRSSYLILANREVFCDVIVNLIDNALKHNSKGSVVEITIKGMRDHVRVSVHDEGGPIARGQVNSLNQNIGKAPQPISGVAGSSGLGLYIVGQLTDSMGGGMGLGKNTQGTTFFVDALRSSQMSLFE